MKLSNETLNILQNYASINPNLAMQKGNEIRTINSSGSVFSIATIAETVETAAIYDLPRFIRTLTLVDDPEIEFGEQQFTIKDTKSKTQIKYTYADTRAWKPVPKGVSNLSGIADINLTADMIRRLTVASRGLKLNSLKFVGDESSARVVLYDSEGAVKDTYEIDLTDVTENVTGPFEKTIKTEYLILVPGLDYKATVCDKLVHLDGGRVKYWIAVDTLKK